MQQLRLLAFAFVVAGVSTSAISFACDGDKATTASAASAMSSCCATKGVSATAASASVASNKKSNNAACSAAQMAACKKSGATTASMEHCATMKGASATTAAMHGNAHGTTVAAGAKGSCSMKGASMTTAVMAGKCDGHGMTLMTGAGHEDCDACADMMVCDGKLRSMGARSQVVALKNGVMYVYTADQPENVRAIQTAIARRNERLTQMTAADKAHLCAECKNIRGAMASGKLTREIVNVESGCLSLLTSNDPKVIGKIHDMSDVQLAAQVTH